MRLPRGNPHRVLNMDEFKWKEPEVSRKRLHDNLIWHIEHGRLSQFMEAHYPDIYQEVQNALGTKRDINRSLSIKGRNTVFSLYPYIIERLIDLEHIPVTWREELREVIEAKSRRYNIDLIMKKELNPDAHTGETNDNEDA